MSSMSLPPDLMAALQGGAGAGSAGVDPNAGMPPGGAPDPTGGFSGQETGGQDESGALDLLRQMIDLGKQYVDVEPDEEDKATMTKIIAQLQAYLAKDQKEQDQMLAGTLSPRGLRKTLGGPQG